MESVIEQIRKTGIIPVVVIDDVKDAVPLAKALIDGGLSCAEVTFRTEAAADALKEMSAAYPKLLLGAGTVLTTEQVDKAVDSGAEFIVSPGLSSRVVQYCIDKNIMIIPGICTPSDIELCLELGLKYLKFFPAESSGGLEMLKALAAPFAGIEFMPTGGINKENVEKYLAYDRVIACGGSWMVKSDLIKNGDFAKITELVKEAAEIMKRVRG